MSKNQLSTDMQIGFSEPLDKRSKHLRNKIVDIFKSSRRGHIGATFSLIEIFRVLYDDILLFDPKNPEWKDRDRCILSKGHGCLAQYVILAEKGFFPEAELQKFCQIDGILGGHPDFMKVPGIEASTGALGHGLSIGAGFAMNAKFEKAGHRVFVVLGDGECNEGTVWEAALSIANRQLDNLCVLIDYNKQQSYDSTYDVQNMEPFAEKWKAFGFEVREVNGHDVGSLKDTLQNIPLQNGKPTALICHTVKGKGLHFAENNLAWHHKSNISDEELYEMRKAIGGDL